MSKENGSDYLSLRQFDPARANSDNPFVAAQARCLNAIVPALMKWRAEEKVKGTLVEEAMTAVAAATLTMWFSSLDSFLPPQQALEAARRSKAQLFEDYDKCIESMDAKYGKLGGPGDND